MAYFKVQNWLKFKLHKALKSRIGNDIQIILGFGPQPIENLLLFSSFIDLDSFLYNPLVWCDAL